MNEMCLPTEGATRHQSLAWPELRVQFSLRRGFGRPQNGKVSSSASLNLSLSLSMRAATNADQQPDS